MEWVVGFRLIGWGCIYILKKISPRMRKRFESDSVSVNSRSSSKHTGAGPHGHHLHLFGFGHGWMLLAIMVGMIAVSFILGYYVAAQSALTVSHTDDQIIVNWQGNSTTLYDAMTTQMPNWVNGQIITAVAQLTSQLTGQCPTGQVMAGYGAGLTRICVSASGGGVVYHPIESVSPFFVPAPILFNYTDTTNPGYPANWTTINLNSPTLLNLPASSLANVKMVKIRVICGEAFIWMTGETSPPATITPLDFRRVCGAGNNTADNADVDVPVTASGSLLNMQFRAQATNPSTVGVTAYLLGYYTN